MSWSRCWHASAIGVRLEGAGAERRARDQRAQGPPRLFRRRSRRPRSQLARRGAHRHGDGGARAGARRHRQPRRQVPALAQGPRREALARAGAHGRAVSPARATPFKRGSARLSAKACRATPGSTTAGSSWRTPASRRTCWGATPRPCAASASTATSRASSTRPGCRSASTGRRIMRGEPMIVYGHTPVAEPAWQGNSVCIDTGCVFGGALTALRWPEREIVVGAGARSVRAACAAASACRPPRPTRRQALTHCPSSRRAHPVSPSERGEGRGEGQILAPTHAAAPHPNPLPMQVGMGRGDCVCARSTDPL